MVKELSTIKTTGIFKVTNIFMLTKLTSGENSLNRYLRFLVPWTMLNWKTLMCLRRSKGLSTLKLGNDKLTAIEAKWFSVTKKYKFYFMSEQIYFNNFSHFLLTWNKRENVTKDNWMPACLPAPLCHQMGSPCSYLPNTPHPFLTLLVGCPS